MYTISYNSFFCLIFSFLIASVNLSSQNSDTPKSLGRTYFLKNCFVVKQPGTILSGQNIIIKDGFISEIGPGLKAPFDAQTIKADSMYVYAGFIDAHSNTGVPKPETKERSKVQDPGNPPNDVAGITPQISSSDVFKSSDKSVADMRAAGFCISQVSPRGLMLPGHSNIFLLGEGANDKMLIKPNTSQNFQLETGRGVYPSTSIAVIAKFRDLYKNANISGLHEEKYKLNPLGLSRPDYSKEMMALYAVTNKKMALYFVAPKTKDVHKALSLKDELGFDLVLSDVKQGWHFTDRIKKENISVLLSLELPEEDKKDVKKEGESAEKKDTSSTKEAKKVEKKEKNPEKDSFDLKKEESVKMYLNQAATFEKQGIKFGFSYLTVKPSDIQKNLRKLIKNGLSENYALAALTTHPAQILGISQLAGTVEKGKIGNLVVTDKSYFDEKATIKYVFVDGQKFDFTEKPKKADNKSSESGSLVGIWNYSVDVPGTTQKGKIIITKSEGEYKIGVINDSSPGKEDAANDISLDGKNLTFNITVDMGVQMKVDFDLNFEDKTFSGSVTAGQMGTFPIKGDFEGNPK